MNKLFLRNERAEKELKLQSGDIVVMDDGEVLLIINTGFNETEGSHKLVVLETGNRWDDEICTLDQILNYVKRNEYGVYRGNEFSLKLGEKLL